MRMKPSGQNVKQEATDKFLGIEDLRTLSATAQRFSSTIYLV